jgi:hypothetical protein
LKIQFLCYFPSSLLCIHTIKLENREKSGWTCAEDDITTIWWRCMQLSFSFTTTHTMRTSIHFPIQLKMGIFFLLSLRCAMVELVSRGKILYYYTSYGVVGYGWKRVKSTWEIYSSLGNSFYTFYDDDDDDDDNGSWENALMRFMCVCKWNVNFLPCWSGVFNEGKKIVENFKTEHNCGWEKRGRMEIRLFFGISRFYLFCIALAFHIMLENEREYVMWLEYAVCGNNDRKLLNGFTLNGKKAELRKGKNC